MENSLEKSLTDTNKQPYVMLWKYEKLYEQKYGKKPVVNKYRDKSAMKDVIDSVGFDRGMALLEYYFRTTKSGHPLIFFLYNFDKLDLMEKEITKDRVNRRLLIKETKKRSEGLE